MKGEPVLDWFAPSGCRRRTSPLGVPPDMQGPKGGTQGGLKRLWYNQPEFRSNL